MTPRQIFQRKLELIEATEVQMRRQLTTAERVLLEAVFDRLLDRMTIDGGRLSKVAGNYSVINDLGTVYDQFARAAITKTVQGMAEAIMGNATLSDEYFRATGALSKDLAKASEASKDLIRERLGITKAGKLQAGGYLQDIVEDNAVRDRVRLEMIKALDSGQDIAGFRNRLRAYLRPQDVNGNTLPGPMEKSFNRHAFDTLQKADRAINLNYAKVLGMPAAYWDGGLIETSRCLCEKLNGKLWTVEEYEAIDKTNWAGKDGSIFVNGGGFNCKHVPRWVGWGDLLLTRTDIIRKDKKAEYREGVSRQVYDPCPDPKDKAK